MTNADQPPGDEYMTLQDAASLLGITRQHMRRLALQYELEVFAAPADRRTRLFRRADVAKLRQPQALGTYPKTEAA